MSAELIIQTLEKLERMHKSLLELANKKTDLLKAGDTDQLAQMLKNEQAHVAAIETLEQQRQKIVTDYLKAKGIAFTDTPTVAQVIEVANDEDKQVLQTIRTRLLQLVEELRERNQLNQQLVMQSLQFVNLTLDMIQPQRVQQSNTFNYSGDEVRGQTAIGKKSYFDSQA